MSRNTTNHLDLMPFTPYQTRKAKKEILDLKKRLKEIAELLATHPDVERGNSKVHLAYHLAKG